MSQSTQPASRIETILELIWRDEYTKDEAKQQLLELIAEVIGSDEPLPMDDREWDAVRYRNQLRAEQRARIGL